MENFKRLYFIDWLRFLAMMSLFTFHGDRFFDFYGWHVKNPQTNIISTIHVDFFIIWMMPLFFVLSGAAVYYSLKFRTVVGFAKERVKRILIPLLILGYFVISPPQSYLDRLTQGKFSGSFWEYLPHYFQGVDMFGGNFPWHAYHLWYLLYLFIFSMFLLPVFKFGRDGKTSILIRISGIFTRSWALFLLLIPLVVINVLIDMKGMGFMRGTGGWDLYSYMFFFVYGYLAFCNADFLKNLQKLKYPLLFIAICTSLGLLLAYQWDIPRVKEDISFLEICLIFLRVICSLSWIGAFIGLSEKYLNFTNKFLSYASEAILPFYILHQLFLLLVGYFVVQWEIHALLKFLIIVVITFIAIMLVYEYLVRRIGFLRLLFGMKKMS